MRMVVLIALLIFSTFTVAQEKTDKKLQKKIEPLIKNFNGKIGLFVKNLSNGRTVSINADSIFPTASMVKIPILIGIMHKIHKGEISYRQEFPYRDSLLYAGVDILGSFKQDEKIEVSKMMMLMLTMSDNTASLWLQSLAGTGTRINELLDSIGMVHTRVNSRTPGRDTNRTLYGWGQTTPREMAHLLEKMYKGELISKASSDWMIRLLGRNFWDEVSISQVPPTVFIASKNGAVNNSRSEVLLVMAPHRPYVFCIATNHIRDESWAESNEAWKLTRELSALLWNYFEPRSKWKPNSL